MTRFVVTRRLRAVACEISEIDVPDDIKPQQIPAWINEHREEEAIRDIYLISTGEPLSAVIAPDAQIGVAH